MSTSQQTDPLIGRLVDGRYRVRARIARGGMATVYVATDLRLERRIALKVMHSHLSDDAVFQSRFIQEARAAARLSDPHVVNVFDQGQDGDMAYLVMEYLPGVTLRELMREQRRLTVPQAVTIMDAVLSGLSAAHRAGIVHRDVKPENVLLAEDGRIKIGDFGLARATSANTATGQMLLGTIAYLAPELVTRGTADARSDIYALGIMLYEMLTGEQPYKGEQPMQIAFQHATESVPRPSARNPGVPEPLDELVLWATEKSPDDRPADAGEMLERLREIERGLGIAPQVQRTLAIAGTLATDRFDSDELTKVLPAPPTGPVATDPEPDNAARLRANTRRRAAQGGWIFVLVIALAALTGGTGWWFGSGPGSLVAVPSVAGQTYAQAAAALQARNFVPVRKDQYDVGTKAGVAIGTAPATGSPLAKAAKVTVLMSLGPRPYTLPKLAGKATADATGVLTADGIGIASPHRFFFTEVPAGMVIGVSVAPRGGGDAIKCDDGCDVHEGDTATLSVSKGPVPKVAGLSVGDATNVLINVGLQVAGQPVQQYSDSVQQGQVIGLSARQGGGYWQPNDTVTLIVSQGPQPVQIPQSIVGSTIRKAVKILKDLGFKVDPGIADTPIIFSSQTTWDVYTVGGTSPGPGTSAPKGSTVTLQPTFGG